MNFTDLLARFLQVHDDFRKKNIHHHGMVYLESSKLFETRPPYLTMIWDLSYGWQVTPRVP